MPFIIAGFLYVVLAAVTLAVVGVFCLAQRQPPGRSTIGGAVGSLAGFLTGCIVGALICMAGGGIGLQVGATTIIVGASLGAALLGTALGAAASRRSA